MEEGVAVGRTRVLIMTWWFDLLLLLLLLSSSSLLFVSSSSVVRGLIIMLGCPIEFAAMMLDDDDACDANEKECLFKFQTFNFLTLFLIYLCSCLSLEVLLVLYCCVLCSDEYRYRLYNSLAPFVCVVLCDDGEKGLYVVYPVVYPKLVRLLAWFRS